MAGIPAYILCGGKSSRFGTDKALVEINGRKLIEIVAAELRKVFGRIIVVAAKEKDYAFLNFECINDIYFNCGPLAGIHTVLRHAGEGKAFIISCDLPNITAGVIEHIINFKTDKPVTIPSSGGKKHYLCGVYDTSILPEAERLLEATKDLEKCASPYDLIMNTGFELIDFDSLHLFGREAFFNLNSKEDLGKITS